uniref:Uncharacterized protein n=1 Tax=Anguilla anguilla TaxID=7936 RepID=A0A0E9U946_ANGAN
MGRESLCAWSRIACWDRPRLSRWELRRRGVLSVPRWPWV